MNANKLLTALTVAISLTTGVAFAQATKQEGAPGAPAAKSSRHDPEAAFAKMDANKDGKLSRDEVKGRKHLEKHFDRIDADKDGALTKEEIKAAHDKRKERRGEHKLAPKQ